MVTDKALWLADFLYRKKKATRSQIEQAWRRSYLSYGKELNRRTFQETKNKVEHLFDTNIAYNPSTYEYSFEDPNVFEEEGVRSWLLKTLSLSATLQKYKNLQSQILLEEPATGYFYLPELLDAMEQSITIELSYHPFNGEPYLTQFSPYCLKAFKRRWYILGFSSHHQEIRTFALDRIENIQQTENRFSIPKDFDNKLYFRDCYGISYAPHLELHTVTFKVSPKQIPYLHTNPIHHSQQEIEEGVFQIRTYISYEVVQEFLSYGSQIEILSPASVREQIKEEALRMVDAYKDYSKSYL